MALHNPTGTNGFAFLEFTTIDPVKLKNQFESMGFIPIAKHKNHDATIYQQNNIFFYLNVAANTHAARFAELHGPSVSAMGFRVQDAKAAQQHAVKQGAIAYQPKDEQVVYDMPAIYGVGNSLIYFIENDPLSSNDENAFFTFFS